MFYFRSDEPTVINSVTTQENSHGERFQLFSSYKKFSCSEFLPSNPMEIMIQTIYGLFTVVKIISTQCLQCLRLSLTWKMAIDPAHMLTVLRRNNFDYFAVVTQLKRVLSPEVLNCIVFRLTLCNDRNRWTLKMQKCICSYPCVSHFPKHQ